MLFFFEKSLVLRLDIFLSYFFHTADYTGSCQVSRSVDPSTLPVCVSHSSKAYGNFDCHPVPDFRTSSDVSGKYIFPRIRNKVF